MPRMPDARIALSGLGGSSDGGGDRPGGGLLGTIGAMMKIKEGQIELRAKQQAEDDDHAIRQTLQQYTNPHEAIGALYQQGRARAAGVLSKQYADELTSQYDAEEKHLKNVHERMSIGTNIVNGITDQQSFNTSLPALTDTLEPVFGPGIRDQLGTTYDPERLKAIAAYGTSTTDHLKQLQDAIDNKREAVTTGLAVRKSSQEFTEAQDKAQDHTYQALAGELSVAGNADEWNQAMLRYRDQLPIDRLRSFGEYQDKESPKRALQLGLDLKERATVEHQAVTEAQGERRTKAIESRTAALNAKPAAGTAARALAPGDAMRAREYHDTAVENLEKDIQNDPKLRKDPKKLSEEGVAERQRIMDAYGVRKLRIENNWRTQTQQPTIEKQAELAQASGDTAKLEEAKTLYKNATGKDLVVKAAPPASRPATPLATPATPLTPEARRARLSELIAAKDLEKNPAKRRAIEDEINTLEGR